MDDVVLVEVGGGVENTAINDDGIVLSEFPLCMDAVKELSAEGELKGEVVLYARLEAYLGLGQEKLG